MAQKTNHQADELDVNSQDELHTKWLEAATAAGYDTHNGQVWVGISGDEGEGLIVPLPMPGRFRGSETPGERYNGFREYAQYALRIGQAAAKAAEPCDTTSKRTAIWRALAKVADGTYRSAHERSNGILRSVALSRLLVLSREQFPQASRAQQEALAEKHLEEYIDAFGDQIIAAGYPVARKERAEKPKPSKTERAKTVNELALVIKR